MNSAFLFNRMQSVVVISIFPSMEKPEVGKTWDQFTVNKDLHGSMVVRGLYGIE